MVNNGLKPSVNAPTEEYENQREACHIGKPPSGSSYVANRGHFEQSCYHSLIGASFRLLKPKMLFCLAQDERSKGTVLFK